MRERGERERERAIEALHRAKKYIELVIITKRMY